LEEIIAVRIREKKWRYATKGVKVIPHAGTVWSSIEMGDGKALFWLELRLFVKGFLYPRDQFERACESREMNEGG